MLKRIVWIMSAFALLTPCSGNSADIAKSIYKSPAIAPKIFDWSGCYVGGNVGWQKSRQASSTNPISSASFDAWRMQPTTHVLDDSSTIGGLHAGCNYQAGKALIGFEGDFDWLRRYSGNVQSALNPGLGGPGTPIWNMQVQGITEWVASLRGRLGYTWDRTLFYATGGAAWNDSTFNSTATSNPNGGFFATGLNASSSFRGEKLGWVLGGGVEVALSERLLFRAEYLHYDFSGASGLLSLRPDPAAGVCGPGECKWLIQSSALTMDTVRIGMTYLFQ